MNFPVRLGVFPALQPLQIFRVRGFESLFPHAETLGYSVCLVFELFLPVYLHKNVGLPGLPAATPPTSPFEYFFFNSLVVELPYKVIFLSSVFFFFNFLLSFFGCGKRQSVSIYTSVLARSSKINLSNFLCV